MESAARSSELHLIAGPLLGIVLAVAAMIILVVA